MKRDLVLVGGLFIVAVLLASEAFFAYLGWSAVELVSGIETSGTLQAQMERIRALRPLVYALAFEGVVLGLFAIVLAVAVWRRRPWAQRAVLIGSFALAVTSGTVVFLSPPLWQRQGIFVLCCGWYWWASYTRRGRLAL